MIYNIFSVDKRFVMNPKNTITTVASIMLILFTGQTQAQSAFDPKMYMQFLENNQALTVDQLLSDNSPKTIYYASRKYPAELNEIPWLDSINSLYSLTSVENLIN